MNLPQEPWSRRRFAAAALVASLALAGCGLSSGGSGSGGGSGAAATKDATLRIGTSADAQSLDPPNFSLNADFARLDLVYDSLIKIGDNNSLKPGLATSWKQDSGTEWTFEIRQGVKFSDGTALDAQAVKTSLERASKATQGKGYLGVITSVEVTGPSEVKIHLSKPFSGLLNNLTLPVSGIVSPTAIKNGTKLATHPVGTGPYVLKSWNPDHLMVLTRNDQYWGAKGAVKSIEIYPIPEASTRFAALQSSQVDVIDNPPPSQLSAIKGSSQLRAVIEPKNQPIFLGFELKQVPDVRVRKAIAMAIDKDAIVKSVLNGIGEPADKGLIPPQLITPASTPINIPHNVAGAKQLIAQSGVKKLTLDLVLPSDYYLLDKDVNSVIKAQLAQIGVTANLKVQESGTWFTSLLGHKDQLYWLGWSMTAGDPADMLTRVFRSGMVNNMSGYSGADKEIDKIMLLPVKSAKREALMNDIQRKLVEQDAVVVPIYYSSNFYATSAKVTGFHTYRSTLWDLSKLAIKQ
jgi:peptide/nickel transport system substrate-binding protein